MIDILFGMIAIQKSAADVAYSLAYKLLKLLETAATVQTAADFAETVAGIVVRFIRQVLLQSDPQSICESEGEQ